jgi:hypothetical protein
MLHLASFPAESIYDLMYAFGRSMFGREKVRIAKGEQE